MILLISCFPWDHPAGGAFIMRSNLRLLPQERVHWIALSRPSGRVPFSEPHVSSEYRAPPAYGNVRLRLSRFWRWYYRRVWSARVARMIARRIESMRPHVIWLMADYNFAPVALRLLPFLSGRRVHISIHDDLEPTARRENMSGAFIGEIRALQAALRELDVTADAVSEELMQAVAPNARRKAIVTMPVDAPRCAGALAGPGRSGPLTIGFSGNFFGRAEFTCFVEGLALWSQRSGREWRLKVFGNEGLGRLDARIEARGFTPAEEVRQVLAQCDLLFLPCPLDAREMLTSVPTKLVTYLEAGRLICAFAPAGSATQRIMEEASVGAVITTIDAEAVVKCLDRLGEWDLARAQVGWKALVDNRFSAARIGRDLTEVLAVAASADAPAREERRIAEMQP